MKVLVDMNLSPRWAAEFRSRGFESIHWSQVGAATAPDEEVLSWCAAMSAAREELDLLRFDGVQQPARNSSPQEGRHDDVRVGDDAHRGLLAAAGAALGARRVDLGLDLLFAHRWELGCLDLVERAKELAHGLLAQRLAKNLFQRRLVEQACGADLLGELIGELYGEFGHVRNCTSKRPFT